MQKQHIRIVVQDKNEFADEFAERLELISLKLSWKYKLDIPPFLIMTSAGDGRQTATLHFLTNNNNTNPEPE